MSEPTTPPTPARGEQTYATLVNSLGGIVWEADGRTFRFTFVSPQAERILGYPLRQWLDEPDFWRNHTHPDDVERCAAFCRDSTARGVDHEFEYRMIAADGRVVWLRDVVTVHCQADGAVHLRGILLDVTERRRAEEEARTNQRRLALALEAGGVGTFDWDLLNDRPGWSPELETLYGLPAGGLSPEAWRRCIHPDDLEAATEACERARREGVIDAEWRVVLPGGVRWLHTRGQATRDQHGRPARMLGTVVDVTERRRIEAEMRQAQKMEAIGRLAGGVAHDFNNLLTVITGYAEVLRDSLTPDDPRTPVVGEIAKAAARAADLTGQLLAFGRKQMLVLRVLDLNALIRDAEGLLRRLVGEDVTLVTALQLRPTVVRADRGQLHQVLLNLAANARDAMPQGGALFFETSEVDVGPAAGRPADLPAGRYVCLTVADTGMGMTPDAVAHLFEPFFTTKGPGRGTGLGLSTVHGIVKQTGGEIDVESRPGRGTTFRVYLPRAEADPTTREDTPAARAAAPRGSERILLVEDEEGVRGVSRFSLRAAGYVVVEAADAGGAMRAWREHEGAFDLLVTDVVLPGEGGRSLAARLAQERPGLKVLFLSGHTEDALLRRGVVEGEVQFLRKPFRPDELVAKVRSVLDERRRPNDAAD